MVKKLAVLAAGMILASSTAFAAEDSELKKFPIPMNHEKFELEEPDYLVGGIVTSVVHQILPISAEARFFAPHMDMNVQSSKFHYNGGPVSLKGTLGFGNDNAPEFIFRYSGLTLDYINVDGDGDRSFSAANPLTFGGNTFTGNVHSSDKFQYAKLTFGSSLFSILGNGVDWNIGLAGMYWKGTVTETATGQSKTKKFGAPLPMIGVGAHVQPLPVLKAYANISGLPLGSHGHFYDFEAGVRVSPVPLVSLNLGYRKIYAHLDYHNDSGEISLKGPFAGLRVDF